VNLVTQKDLHELIAFLAGPTPMFVPIPKDTLLVLRECLEILKDSNILTGKETHNA